jgi:hypothetical protein
MAVRSKRLFGPVSTGQSGAVLYTCPAGETTLLKHLSLYLDNPSSQTVFGWINATGSPNVWLAEQVTGLRALQLRDMFVVLHPGDTLMFFVPVGNVTVTGHGAQLEGTAD